MKQTGRFYTNALAARRRCERGAGELTWVGGVRQQAGAADADREEVRRLVLALVAVIGGALPADRLARPVLRVGEPPDGQRPVVVEAELLRRAVESRLRGQRWGNPRLEGRAEREKKGFRVSRRERRPRATRLKGGDVTHSSTSSKASSR